MIPLPPMVFALYSIIHKNEEQEFMFTRKQRLKLFNLNKLTDGLPNNCHNF